MSHNEKIQEGFGFSAYRTYRLQDERREVYLVQRSPAIVTN